MNWFQRFFTNPNVHAIGAAALNAVQPAAIALGHPEIALAASVLGTTTGLIAAATPENLPSPIPGIASGGPIVHLPPAAAGGSYHASDWMNLAAQLAAQFAPKS